MDNHKISVIMGIYNCAVTLPKAVDSILAQTYSNWELIMCDDCSTDNTYEVAKIFQEQYPDKIKLLRNNKNMHLAYSLNRCLEYATGKFVARMDGDDISVPDRFEKQISYLNTHPDIQLVGSAMQLFNDKDGNIRIIYKPEHTDKWTLHEQMPFHHPTIMTYKSVYDALEGYTISERTNRGQDYDLWFRFFAKGFTGEDLNAIKRRSLKVRMLAFQTTIIGYNMLGYPKMWLIKEFFISFLKGITPHKLQYLYRKLQQRRSK